jgi:hypothetical protein
MLIERWAAPGEEPGPDDLVIWVLFNRLTTDFPGLYVLRRQWVTRTEEGAEILKDCQAITDPEIEPLRARLPEGVILLPLMPYENMAIEEVWG